jgi:hypothetical protein
MIFVHDHLEIVVSIESLVAIQERRRKRKIRDLN